jgi:hypothetical protein
LTPLKNAIIDAVQARDLLIFVAVLKQQIPVPHYSAIAFTQKSANPLDSCSSWDVNRVRASIKKILLTFLG